MLDVPRIGSPCPTSAPEVRMMRQGRQDSTDRRQQRMVGALEAAAQNGSPVSVSGVARQAGVDRMERLGITDLATRQLGELSGGQRQPALIAQGIAQESDLLLLDEPTTGLDPEARDRIAALLTELVADDSTVVQATHDLEAARSADACLLLHDGRPAGQGHPEQLLTASTLAHIWQPV
ncbi:ATP-binding cassette domain-containing protein [Streptomyces sp. MNU76]|uniref:ATP-binding cassette domain-containing protein n=1 Tax=Streptomyces sp. MNU76 TaxID=2560026 RepID=UPI0027DF2A48|nr:ATP-binding cassette domain-containing protein [Streptomyces sp. MNU76]